MIHTKTYMIQKQLELFSYIQTIERPYVTCEDQQL